MFALTALALGLAAVSWAENIPNLHAGRNDVIYGGGAADRNSAIVLMGPGGPYEGDFEDAKKAISLPFGWNSINIPPSHWQISTINNTKPGMVGTNGWCGANIPSCIPGPDDPWGYGNNWKDYLDLVFTVPDPGASCTVEIKYNIFWDSEPGYDYTYIYKIAEDVDPILLQSYDDTGSSVGAFLS